MNSNNKIDLQKIFEKEYVTKSQELLDAVRDFTFLWMCFEKNFILSEEKKSKNILIDEFINEKFNEINKSKTLRAQYLECSKYFHTRYQNQELYTKLGQFTKPTGEKKDVQVVLDSFYKSEFSLEADESLCKMAFKCCMQIIYKLRCNLFHGAKWSQDLDAQVDNLTQANLLLFQINVELLKK